MSTRIPKLKSVVLDAPRKPFEPKRQRIPFDHNIDRHGWKTSIEVLAQLLNGEIEPLHRRCVECELARQRVLSHGLRSEDWSDELEVGGSGEVTRLACIRIVERRIEKLKFELSNQAPPVIVKYPKLEHP